MFVWSFGAFTLGHAQKAPGMAAPDLLAVGLHGR